MADEPEKRRTLDNGNRRVVILVALDVEYDAVLAHLNGVTQRFHPAGTLFEVGCPGPGSAEIALGLTGPGNAPAAVLAERAIALFKPQALFFVGVAGGLNPDIELGDVVVGTKIYSYHRGKETAEGFMARPQAWAAPHELDQLAHHVSRSRLLGRITDRSFAVHFKPIAAGEVVLNSRVSPLAEQLRRNYNDAAAIEMESAGASQAAHFNKSWPTLTVRGISDCADGNKHTADEKGWQPVAAANAAEFAVAVAVALLSREGESVGG